MNKQRQTYLSTLTLDSLTERLNREKTKTITTEVMVERTYSNKQWGDRDSGGYGAETVMEKEYETVNVSVPDYETRLEAVKDAADLYNTLNKTDEKAQKLQDILAECYKSKNPAALRHIAGKALGHSFLKRLIDIYLKSS